MLSSGLHIPQQTELTQNLSFAGSTSKPDNHHLADFSCAATPHPRNIYIKHSNFQQNNIVFILNLSTYKSFCHQFTAWSPTALECYHLNIGCNLIIAEWQHKSTEQSRAIAE